MNREAGPFLLVEDDRQHAKIILRTLEENRISNPLEWVNDGEKALQFLRKEPPYENAATPAVVLLDLNLPKVDGHEILSAIKDNPKLAPIPVVVLTTSDAETDRWKAYEHRANSYLVKPIDFSKFQRMVSDLSFYWGVWNRVAHLEDES